MPSTLTITSSDFTSFSANTLIKSSEINSNFSVFRGHILPVATDTSTAATTQTYDLGSTDYKWRNIYGSMNEPYASTSGSTTLTNAMSVIECDLTTTATLTLPTASGITGKTYTIKKIIDNNVVLTIDGNGSETIDGTTTAEIDNYNDSLKLVSDGTNWQVLEQKRTFLSRVKLHTANGHGSTNNKIRRFSTTLADTGNSITYTDDASLGASFTINRTGLYNVTYSDGFNGGSRLGLTVNSASLTTSINVVEQANVLTFANVSFADIVYNISWSGYLTSGDVVRCHTNGDSNGATPDDTTFTMTRIG